MIASYFTYDCDYSYEVTRNWTVHSVDSSTGSEMNLIDLKLSKDAMNSDLLFIKAKSLDYGLYKIAVKITPHIASMNVTEKFGTVFTFIKIEPSGFVLNGLKDGLNSITVGKLQSFKFEPRK